MFPTTRTLSFSFCCVASYLATLFSLLFYPAVAVGASAAPFPVYDSIRPNVSFWEKVYSTYSINTAIIHDQDRLDIIYTTIQLIDAKVPGAKKKNDKKIKSTKNYYAKLLRAIANKSDGNSGDAIRIKKMFGPQTSASQFRTAAKNIRAQHGLRERFREGVVRSGAYMAGLKKMFRSYRLPEDLAYLPHVESSFNPKAYSKFGASGMWQFTRATGKEFLTIDYIVDERRDPIISADGAAQLLQRNFKLLGSWPLALTAYNYGAAGMKRAVAQEGTYENIFKNYRKGYFKFASRNFYSEFVAAVAVAKKLERSGQIRFASPVPYVTVPLPSYANAKKLCRYLSISVDEFKRYNPSLRPPVFDGTKYIPKNFKLKLPIRYKNSPLLSGVPSAIFSKTQKRSQFYRVKRGDTAGEIARTHGISLNSLIRANHLNKQAMVRIGQNLRIPPATGSTGRQGQSRPAQGKADPVVTHTVLEDNKKRLPETETTSPIINAAVSGNLQVTLVNKKQQLTVGAVEVQPNESVGLFAEWLKVTPDIIRLENGMGADVDIHPGQTINLEFISVTVEEFEATRFDFHQEIQEDFFSSYTIAGIITYQVKKGDSVWDICFNKYDIPLWLLKKYNDSMSFQRLEQNSILNIPVLKEI
ncbi:MAG: LysM peptidoglycan-binding domain-containing protein [Desulfobulbaceae bacterium]|nr:MAG: LysM peptidoglycan-binding domain-containing protein [Desulfobulbaceae bacterium]